MRFFEAGERKAAQTAWRTDVGLCADTTYAILSAAQAEGTECAHGQGERKVPCLVFGGW